MLVLLSQKVDSESAYADELFNSYHYPARYRNQLHEGDVFIYYQGNRYAKDQRYYFGVGTVGDIFTADGENYYAKLLDCQKFEKKVPIYLPDGGYIEQLGYDTVRNSINPPWQSSIRPLSRDAFSYILNAAGLQTSPNTTASIDDLKEKLKHSIREFFIENNPLAIGRIESISAAIGRAISIDNDQGNLVGEHSLYRSTESPQSRLESFLEYCRTMKMSYSYKPILILALLQAGEKNGTISINDAARYFRNYYNGRRDEGLPAEKHRCIYQKINITDKQIAGNVIANPVRVLVESGFFSYSEDTDIFSINSEVWTTIDRKAKATIIRVCNQKLNEYFAD